MTWYGVNGPAQSTADVLASHGRSKAALDRANRNLRSTVAARLHPLTRAQREALTAPIEPVHDQRARTRIAALFDLPKPAAATPPPAPPWGARGAGIERVAVRCLAALRSLTTEQLMACVREYRHRRAEHAGDPVDDLIELLHRSQALRYTVNNRWTLTGHHMPQGRDRELLAALRLLGQVFTHTDYRRTVTDLGFTDAYRAPWVVRVHAGRGRYAVVDQVDGHHVKALRIPPDE